MKTVVWIIVGAVGVSVLAYLFGIVGFHYPHIIVDEPFKNPTEVIGVVDEHLYLSDLRVIKLHANSHEPLAEVLSQSDYLVDVIGLEPYVRLYARKNGEICGTSWTQSIRIPLFPETVYRNRREMIGYGEFVD
ncbi:MAG: hypothetical protein AAF802_32600 [Planctomycetota bacterium]